MPTYVYKCESCGYHFEKLQKFSDKPVKKCPHCQGHVKRLIYPAGIVFKGSGWYITDSRSSSSSTPKAKSSDTKTAESPSAEAKPTESKPAEPSKSASAD